MTVKRISASVVMGLFWWILLMVIREEWRLPYHQATFGPPPPNPDRLWVLLTLIAISWCALTAFLRWADRSTDPQPPDANRSN